MPGWTRRRTRPSRAPSRWIDSHGPGRRDGREPDAPTYDTAVLALLLLDRGRPEDRERIERLVRILERSQAQNGQWSYAGKPAGRRPEAGDNSNTQFAVLALGSRPRAGRGCRSGAPEARPRLVDAVGPGGRGLRLRLRRLAVVRQHRLDDGRGNLVPRHPPGGPRRRRPGVAGRVQKHALACLARGFEVDRNFGRPQGGAKQRQRNAGRGWNHYFLWSVERAMVLAEQERLGSEDWYATGARHLLETQKDDGSWRGEHPLYATCFALLFLTRAADPPRCFTPRREATGPTTPGDGSPTGAPQAAPPPVPGDVAAWLEEALPPDELRARCLARGPASLVPLVAALGARTPVVRQRANEALRGLLGDDRVGRADRHPLPRGRLKLWVRKHAPYLEAQGGRFREVGTQRDEG